MYWFIIALATLGSLFLLISSLRRTEEHPRSRGRRMAAISRSARPSLDSLSFLLALVRSIYALLLGFSSAKFRCCCVLSSLASVDRSNDSHAQFCCFSEGGQSCASYLCCTCYCFNPIGDQQPRQACSHRYRVVDWISNSFDRSYLARRK